MQHMKKLYKTTKRKQVFMFIALALTLAVSVYLANLARQYGNSVDAATSAYCGPSNVNTVTCSNRDQILKCKKFGNAFRWTFVKSCRTTETCSVVSSTQAKCDPIWPCSSASKGDTFCLDNWRMKCDGTKYNFDLNCSSISKWCNQAIGNCVPFNTGTPKPSQTSSPTPTSVQTCKDPNFCATRTECTQFGGTTVSGKCSNVGEICCKEF